MPVLSAGILLYRRREGVLELLLTHAGGPYWRNKDDGAWMIPKGMVEEDEEPLACALREFGEELGVQGPGPPEPLATIRQKGGKWVEAFAAEGDLDADAIVSNMASIEWPPRSGRIQQFPEIDRAAWFGLAQAREKILPSQAPLLDALEAKLG